MFQADARTCLQSLGVLFGLDHPRARVQPWQGRLPKAALEVDALLVWIQLGQADRLIFTQFQSTSDRIMGRRMLRSWTLLDEAYRRQSDGSEREDRHVAGYLVLMHPRAQHPKLTGQSDCLIPVLGTLCYPYGLLRLWQRPVSAFFEGGWVTWPWKVLGDVDDDDVPEVFHEAGTRIIEHLPRVEARDWVHLLYSF